MKSNLALSAFIALAFFWQSSCGKADTTNSTGSQNTITANTAIVTNTNSTSLSVNANSIGTNSNVLKGSANNANAGVKPTNTNSNAVSSNANSSSAPSTNSQSNANGRAPIKKKKIPFYGELGNDAQRAPDEKEQLAPKGSTPGVVNPSGTPSTKPTPR